MSKEETIDYVARNMWYPIYSPLKTIYSDIIGRVIACPLTSLVCFNSVNNDKTVIFIHLAFFYR
ncbi:hypothetical protein IEQ34_015207 [Dendrobium chrysotoxum]|uniref:Uncharacterized protein n=1 Tax=Dendrobium chrysotoxum TaxID=161865 RepID=A0AAV7FZH0_DENCH|nr:hypothetical protein IEQ34_015207 [Dendrobium chrysotoxum]